MQQYADSCRFIHDFELQCESVIERRIINKRKEIKDEKKYCLDDSYCCGVPCQQLRQ